MLINENDYVIIHKEDYFRLLKITRESMERIDGSVVCLGNAIGLPYGSLFAIDGDNIVSVVNQLNQTAESSQFHHPKDNRNIFDSTSNQLLACEDIKQLRMSGVKSAEIIGELVRGNCNFDKKTSFSQEKYLTKKRKKHMNLFSIERPCSRILCEVYSKLRKDKCLGLRFDAVCHILTYANVRAGAKILLAETCAGLLLNAVLERLGPASLGGSVIQFYHGTNPPKLDINPVLKSVYDRQVFSVCFRDVLSLLTLPPTRLIPEKSSDTDLESMTVDVARFRTGELCVPEKSKLDAPDSNKVITDRKLSQMAKRQLARDQLIGLGTLSADALIIATRFHPVDITLLLMQFLPVGKQVVVYSQYLQPLVDLYNALKRRGGVTQLRLMDTWFRIIQVLPDRTHPEVRMQSSGGYLLCAYTVEPQPPTDELLSSGLISSGTKHRQIVHNLG